MPATLSTCDVLCTYGLPKPNRMDEMLRWLEESDKHYLVILEDGEPSLPDHPRIRHGVPADEESLKRIAWELVFLEFDYDQIEDASSKQAFAQMAFFHEGIHLVASDFGERGVDKLKNFLNNEKALERSKRATDLFGAFSGTAAIICGAGPSLEVEAPYLRMLKDRALFFGGGTALSALSELGITPHFGGMIDPHPPSKRYFKNRDLNVPTLFQTRVHPEYLKRMDGPLLWTPGSKNDLFEKENFDGGWNISTFLTAIACHLGCNPIILVGVDLAQTKEKTYANDLEREEKGDLIHVEGDMYTRKDWLFAADWLSEFSQKHPEVEWINASDGLALKGFEKKGIRDLSFEKQGDLYGQVHAAVHSAREGSNTLSGQELKESLEKVGGLCVQMLEHLESIFPAPPEKDGEHVLLQVEIEKEIAYEQFLKPVWNIWKHVFEREMNKDIPKAYGIGLNQWLFMKGICDEAREI